MNETDIFVKTSAGTEEVKARSRQLPQRLRTMLIMVDGMRTVAQLREAAATLAVPGDFLATLLEQGLIEARLSRSAARAAAKAAAAEPATAPMPAEVELTEPERFRAAQKFMNDSVVDALGLRAFFFTLKIEKASTCDDLRGLIPEFTKAIEKSGGEELGKALTVHARAMLG
jgi:hypothetical protein